MMVQGKVSVVAPLYNEAENAPELYRRLTSVLRGIGRPYEIVFVDDGSKDRTFEVIREIQYRDDCVHVLRLRRNFGQTPALKAGFDFAEGDVIVAMDGDLQHLPEEIPLLLEKIDEGYDIASGRRAKRVDNFLFRRLPSSIANSLMAWMSGIDMHDFGSTFKAYRKDVIKNTELYGEMHRFIPALANWQGIRIVEVPITNGTRRHGKSNYTLSRTFRVIFDILTVKFLMDYLQRPLQLFGLWGLGFGTAGFVILAVITIMKIFQGVSIYQYLGSILLGLLLLFVGIQLIALGLATEVTTRIYHTVNKRPIYIIRERCSTRKEKGEGE